MSVLDLPAQVADLLRRVAALESAPAPAVPDQLNPNVFSINSAGQVEEHLTGALTAKGIVFEEGEGIEEQPEHSIRWLGPEQALKGEILTTRVAGGQELLVQTQTASNQIVNILLKAALSANTAITVSVYEEIATLFDAKGRSSFLQLGAGVAAAKLIYGISSVEWAVKGFESAGKVIATPFATADAWVGFPVTGSGNSQMGSGGAEASQVTFFMRQEGESAPGSKAFFSYFIIGH